MTDKLTPVTHEDILLDITGANDDNEYLTATDTEEFPESTTPTMYLTALTKEQLLLALRVLETEIGNIKNDLVAAVRDGRDDSDRHGLAPKSLVKQIDDLRSITRSFYQTKHAAELPWPDQP